MHNYLKLVFSKLDKNQNGKVSAFELKIYISRMNMPHVDDFVEELDRNGDSQFTLEEFINLYLEMLVRVRELGTPTMPLPNPDMATKKATFGMSWFWFPEAQFGCTKGVVRTRVGYAGGTKANPTYYAMGDHTETIDLDYDPNVTSYAELLHIFWNNHDPCTKNKRQYMSAIFYHDEEQKELALQTKDEMSKKGKKITTEIAPAKEFTDAEDYHQKYMLQHHPWLLESLDIHPGDYLIKSHVAARLNGYIGGYGNIVDFNLEAPQLGLNEKMMEYVVRKMKSKH